MTLKRTLKYLFSASTVLSLAFVSQAVEAGRVKITNHSHHKVRINVIPEPLSERLPYCWKCFDNCLNTHGQQVKEIIVPLDAFRGEEYFGVVGTEGGFLSQGECRNLSVFKNYEVIFEETSLNVSCKCKEI